VSTAREEDKHGGNEAVEQRTDLLRYIDFPPIIAKNDVSKEVLCGSATGS
jgi:hypothetical protein